jgi:bifunctional non-homologous end joining protein LigD
VRTKRLPTGFIIPAQPVLAARPPSGPGWVHGRLPDDRPPGWLRSATLQRNATDWTARLHAIADGAERIKAKSFTIDGEAVVLGPNGLSQFEELSRRQAARTAILYAFDLIEHDGKDLRDLPFLNRKAALAQLLRNTKAGILLTNTFAEDGATVFAHACQLGLRATRARHCHRRGPRSQPPQHLAGFLRPRGAAAFRQTPHSHRALDKVAPLQSSRGDSASNA